MMSVFSNLRVRFLLLVLLAMVPAVGLLYVTAAEQRDTAVENARGNARRLANLAAADQGRLIESTRQLLTVLARVPEVRGGDATGCSALLADLKEQFPLYANLGVIAPDGFLVCSALPVSDPLDLSDRSYFRTTVETDAFTIGEYQVGRVTNVASLNCGYPLHDESGRFVGVIFAALDLAWFNRFASAAQLPEGAVMTVYDEQGTILVRAPDPEDLVGRSALGTPVVATMVAQRVGLTGLSDVTDEHGEEFLYAFAPLANTTTGDAALSVALPRASAVEAADRAFGRSLTRLGLVILVILVAAWVGGDLLVRGDTEANKALVRRLYDAFDTGSVALLDEVVAPDFVDHDPMPGQAPSLAGLKQAVGLFRAAFPDGTITVEELVAEGDRVVAHVTLRGTHLGTFAGASASDRVVSADGIETYRLAGGKIVEGWSRFGPLVGGSDVASAIAAEARPSHSEPSRRWFTRALASISARRRHSRTDPVAPNATTRQERGDDDGALRR